MKRLSIPLFLVAGLVALVLWMPKADAFLSLYTDNCTACHSTTVNTCDGCHAHGVHSDDAKDDINVTGVTDKATYVPGETVTVTITGGYRTGWIRAVLYDENMTEIARSACPGGQGGCTTSVYPVTLTAPAPATAGTYTWNVSWYGNQFDMSDAGGATFFGPNWTPDTNNPGHGQEIVSTNSFEVASAAAPDISLDPTSLDFGTVNIGDAPTLTTQVQNIGTADLTVTSITLCAGTSTEFTWTPPALPIIVAAGGSETLSVVYTPTDTGIDTGCLEISSNDPDTPTATLNVTGAVLPTETECFDSTDNDSDGLIDCADTDCAGAANGSCDTGIPGVCSTGQTQCVSGAAECVQTVLPSPETIAANTCNDGLDNDCDGLIDAVDPGCQVAEICNDSIDNDSDGLIDCADTDCANDPACQVAGEGDVSLKKLVGPKQIVIANKKCSKPAPELSGMTVSVTDTCSDGEDALGTGTRVVNVLAEATGLTEPVLATVTLTADAGAGVMITIEPASITKEIEPEVDEPEVERFGFKVTAVCAEEGSWAVNWTAAISSAQDSDPTNNTQTGTVQVICKSPAKNSKGKKDQ
jgi:hypothetical protein